ncbi:adhesin transport system membrane fusion protein [Paraburkholderia caballeronis]|uniref:HlyD family type I secretion periplasmic adaptor subunit n=1 Tax=Paraburkholderia caballeronis TaxID=416943 RepID=UPI001066A46E|nr:HlyD family type I secretion periplasmic adaptor subunit [Paraburkholderia caballeronis]TDV23822.1 adhesin transport system membrane fusion protein [Paraburkholderia caballeronis]
MQARTPNRLGSALSALRATTGDTRNDYFTEHEQAPRSSRLLWIIGVGLLVLFAWSWFFKLDEVSTGTGKVIPFSREQVIQSLEGGILDSLSVKEGDLVQPDEVLAQLARAKTESAVDESASRARAALATAARLRAEVDGGELVFPPEVMQDPQLVRSETALYKSRRDGLSRSLGSINDALALVRKELQITQRLATQGAASDVEVLRLKRQASDLEMKASDTRDQYYVKSREELAKANSEVEAQRSVTRGRADALSRLTVKSPVKGVVKDIEVNTVGGVIPPNGRLMTIVPMGDQLVVEARVSPRDVAFIHPGQDATVKITAYDYSIFGGMKGKVTSISPDTIQDDVRKDVYYYRVFVRTDTDTLKNKQGKAFPIFPGMVATVDIHTGSKTVWEYLTKPLNRAREALRER